MRLPITIIIPVVLVVSTTIASLLMYMQDISSEEDSIRKHAMHDLKLDIARLQNILYNLLTEDNIAEARVNLSVTAMNPAMQALILADETNKVLAANRYIWTGNHANKVVDFDVEIAAEVKRSNQSQTFFDNERKNILKGYYPVVLQLKSTNGYSGKKSGTLFARVDIKHEIIAAHQKALNHSLLFGSVMLLSSLLVALLLHILISRRLNALALASEDIAAGKYDTQVNISGNDEITHLADSFNLMVDRINKAFTSREKAETELLKLNETLESRVNERTQLLREAHHIAQMGNWVWNIPEESLYWSDEVFTIFGYKEKRFTPTVALFFESIYFDDLPVLEREIESAFKHNKKYKLEHRILLPDGSVRWIRQEGLPTLDNDGNRLKLTGIVQDITGYKKEMLEREQLEREIQQMQKMESLGQLTGGIAHDFNNILAIISGYTELAKNITHKIGNEKLSRHLEQIYSSSKRASELIAQMLAFSRTDSDYSKKENLSVNKLLSEIKLMLQPLLSSSISLNVLIKDDFNIYANSVMLNQVLMNLCVNAKDAMRDGVGEIDIEAKKVSLQNETCSSCFNSFSDDFIQISVSDNGIGMAEEKLHRIFEPFFTTKGVGKGSGMGLSMVHGIMHKHDGHVIVESKPDYSSTFKLLFPVSEHNHKLELKEESISRDDYVGDEQGTILVVDDEEALAEFIKDFLENYNFNPVVMHDSRKALEYFLDNFNDIDLVLTDYTMPGMTGGQLAEYMITTKPDIPIILCSGYSDLINKEEALNLGIKDYIEKPINTKLLLEAIRLHINKE